MFVLQCRIKQANTPSPEITKATNKKGRYLQFFNYFGVIELEEMKLNIVFKVEVIMGGQSI